MYRQLIGSYAGQLDNKVLVDPSMRLVDPSKPLDFSTFNSLVAATLSPGTAARH